MNKRLPVDQNSARGRLRDEGDAVLCFDVVYLHSAVVAPRDGIAGPPARGDGPLAGVEHVVTLSEPSFGRYDELCT